MAQTEARAVTSLAAASLIDQVDAWGAENGGARSEAFRRLVELGLKAKPKS
jgi:hypothetical protein